MGYNLPPGVTGAEDYFYPPDPPTCTTHGMEMVWNEDLEEWGCVDCLEEEAAKEEAAHHATALLIRTAAHRNIRGG